MTIKRPSLYTASTGGQTNTHGRPITLDCTHARIKRSELEYLQSWTAMPELTMTHPDGRTFNVMFTATALTDIVDIKNYKPADKGPDDPMTANINLMTI